MYDWFCHFGAYLLKPSDYKKVPLGRIMQFIQDAELLREQIIKQKFGTLFQLRKPCLKFITVLVTTLQIRARKQNGKLDSD